MKYSNATSFESDNGNRHKNVIKHNVTQEEYEECFFNVPFVVENDTRHSQFEIRYFALGITTAGRKLFIVFTLRKYKIRVISARDMNKNERRFYDKKSNTLF